jgi:hypothetical protein
VLFYRSAESTGFALKAVAPAPASMGVTLTDLPAGPTSRWDRANVLRVKMASGQLASVSDIALLGGANAAAIDIGDGRWEVVQFAGVRLEAPSVYDLAMLLRGQGGSDDSMRDVIPAGARFVVLDRAVTAVAMTAEDVGTLYNWKAGPAGRDMSSTSYLASTQRYSGAGLRPLSPVHVTGVRQNGDLTISWIRRTRISGDGWELADVPLGEEGERYEVDVLAADGTTVLRTLTSVAPRVVYTSAQQAADFGVLPSAVAIRVYQLGLSFGRGAPRTATV